MVALIGCKKGVEFRSITLYRKEVHRIASCAGGVPDGFDELKEREVRDAITRIEEVGGRALLYGCDISNDRYIYVEENHVPVLAMRIDTSTMKIAEIDPSIPKVSGGQYLDAQQWCTMHRIGTTQKH